MKLFYYTLFAIVTLSIFLTHAIAAEPTSYDFLFLTPADTYFEIQTNTISETSKNNLTLSKASYNIDIINEKDILNMPFRNISEAINILPSIANQTGGDYIQPSIPSIFGANMSHTKIVIDGIILNTQLDGTFDLSNFQMATIDKIEVAKTPLSSLWGSSLGGIIYLKTKEPKEDETKLNFSYGEFNSIRSSLETSFHIKDLKVLFIPEYSKCDGYMDEGESYRNAYFIKANYPLNDSITIEGETSYNVADIGEYVQTRFGSRSEYDSKVLFGGLKITFDNLFSNNMLTANLFFNGYKNEGERRHYFLNDSTNTPYRITTYDESKKGIKGDISKEFEDSVLSFECNYDTTDMETNNFSRNHEFNSSYISSNLTHDFSSKITTQAFLRFDSNNAYDDEFSYGTGLSYKIDENFKIGITISKDYNAPPLTFRYIDRPDRNLKSNEDLNAETANTINLSLEKTLNEKLLIKITTYHQDMDNGIVFTSDADGMFFYENFDEIVKQGVEATIVYNILPNSILRLGGTYNDIFNKDTDEVITSKVRRKYNIAFESTIKENWIFTLTGNYIWWNMDDFYNAKDRNFLFDAKLTKNIDKNTSFYIAGYNLFNTDLFWIDVYPNPRRHVETGFSYKL